MVHSWFPAGKDRAKKIKNKMFIFSGKKNQSHSDGGERFTSIFEVFTLKYPPCVGVQR